MATSFRTNVRNPLFLTKKQWQLYSRIAGDSSELYTSEWHRNVRAPSFRGRFFTTLRSVKNDIHLVWNIIGISNECERSFAKSLGREMLRYCSAWHRTVIPNKYEESCAVCLRFFTSLCSVQNNIHFSRDSSRQSLSEWHCTVRVHHLVGDSSSLYGRQNNNNCHSEWGRQADEESHRSFADLLCWAYARDL